jgi:hypothetical protein
MRLASGDYYFFVSYRIGTIERLTLAEMGWAAAHLGGQLILPLAQVSDMPEQPIGRPLDEAHFGHHFWSHPMDPAKHQR